jgi:hypothetical protein
MQPIDIVERVKATYKSYIRTAFPVVDEDLRQQIYRQIEQTDLLWRGPFLSLQRPYQRVEKSLSEQAGLGLHRKLLSAGEFTDDKGDHHPPLGDWRLYRKRAPGPLLTSGLF